MCTRHNLALVQFKAEQARIVELDLHGPSTWTGALHGPLDGPPTRTGAPRLDGLIIGLLVRVIRVIGLLGVFGLLGLLR